MFKRTILRHLCCLVIGLGFVCSLLVAVAQEASAAELRGKVVEVSGLNIKIRVDGAQLPNLGDRVEVRFSLPGGDTVTVGTWRVSGQDSGVVSASVVSHTGKPRVGQRAIIFSDTPWTPGEAPEQAQTQAKTLAPASGLSGTPKATVKKAGPSRLKGKVVAVSGNNLKIRLNEARSPKIGDKVQISFVIPKGDRVTVGTWTVSGWEGDLVVAAEYERTGQPDVGQDAVVYSWNPSSRPKTSLTAPTLSSFSGTTVQPVRASKPAAVLPRARVPKAKPVKTVKKKTSPPLPAVLVRYIKMIQSPNPETMREGAKKVYDTHYVRHPELLRVAHRQLLRGYMRRSDNRYHVDGMSWLCKILGNSKNTRYAKTLRIVASGSPSRKIRRYARKGLKMMGLKP